MPLSFEFSTYQIVGKVTDLTFSRKENNFPRTFYARRSTSVTNLLPAVYSHARWRKQNFWGDNCLILGKQQYFYLGRRFLKRKMTRNAKLFLGGMSPWLRLCSCAAEKINTRLQTNVLLPG